MSMSHKGQYQTLEKQVTDYYFASMNEYSLYTLVFMLGKLPYIYMNHNHSHN